MISVDGLAVEFGGTTLFSDISFVINEKDRIALMGKNGAGKSTLLKILAGTRQPTRGKVSAPKDCVVAYLPQHLMTEDGRTVFDETAQAFSHLHEMEAQIEKLNKDETVNGILVQLPVPKHIDPDKIIRTISPEKDVDGFHPQNVGKLVIGEEGFVSCTPAGVIQLLKRSGIEISGKNCVVVGRSNIVGKPMALLMLRENATVTIAHSKTKNLKELCQTADILIVAIGKPQFITADYVKEGAVVIDVGIHRDENNKLCGDVRYEEVAEKASAITPVPGGVGPMTIAMLMSNCVESLNRE